VSDTKEMAKLPYADFTMKDLEAVDKFKENGMLGLHTLADTDVERSMALYMDGKSYRQIAEILKINKTVILFLAHKFNWFELRQDYLSELVVTLKDKVTASKLQSQEFLLGLIMAYQKKVGKNVNQYLRTDNGDFFDKIDSKDINTVLKVMDLLYKFSSENFGTSNDKPLVGLNGLGEGLTITKTGKDSVDITPKAPSPFSSKLKAFADLKREQERIQNSPRDIIIETPNGKESENKDEK